MKFSVILIFGFLVLCLASICSLKRQEDTVNNFINFLINNRQITGAAIGIEKKGNWIVWENFGYADSKRKYR
ncbi:MAG: hypothetical protein WCA84_16260 [Ignavibacteriaceae bacterium]|jgi:hypothetical protein